MALGLALVAFAAARVGTLGANPDGGGAPGAVAPYPQVGVARETYEPGHASGWHVHPGAHSVVVLAGTLTVYDESCVRAEYGPGETYLGGSTPHLASNEGTERADLVVTFVFATSATVGPGHPVPAPPACPAS